MTDAPAIEGTAEDLMAAPSDAHPAEQPASTAVVRRERRSEVIRPLDPDQLIDSFHAYQDLLPKLLDASDYQGTGSDAFVKKSGWRKIATAFDLDVQVVRWHVERDDDGTPLRVEVLARAVAPSGRSMDGDGYCTLSEFTGKRRNDPKLENTMRGTATTRAKNRAISDLVGMGEVSAEEVSGGGHDEPQGPPHGPAADDGLMADASTALLALLAGNADAARGCWGAIKTACGGYMPVAAAVALTTAGAAAPDLPWNTPADDPGAAA